METVLKDVNAVIGVTGSFVCDAEGQVLVRSLPGVFDEASLSLTGQTMTQTIAGLKITRRRKVGDIDLLYGAGRLVVKNLQEGCLCILCMRHINVPLLNLTANLAAKKLTAMLKEAEPVEAKPAASLTIPDALKVMSGFTDLLIEELGERGFGRDKLLQIIRHRLKRLKIEHPLLESIVIDEGKMDISPLQSGSSEEIGAAIAALIRAICYTCLGVLGAEAAQAKYRQVYEPFYHQNKEVFDHLGLGRSLEKAATLEGPLGVAELQL